MDIGDRKAEQELIVVIERIKGKLNLALEGKDHLKELFHLYQESQDALNNELKKRLLKQENCPCPVRRDPVHKCRLAILENKLAKYIGIGIGVGFVFQVLLQIGLHFFFRR